MYVCVYVCVCVCMCACVYVCDESMHLCMCVCVCLYVFYGSEQSILAHWNVDLQVKVRNSEMYLKYYDKKGYPKGKGKPSRTVGAYTFAGSKSEAKQIDAPP